MDALAQLVFAVVALYVLYWVIRYAVRDGIRDARRQESDSFEN